jgi:hypothetical protein
MNILTVNLVLSTLVFWVPALLATHYLTFIVLTERTARWAS